MALRVCTGFEHGVSNLTSLTKGNTGSKLFDIAAGSPTMQSTAPVRSGTYALELNAAAESVGWDANTYPSGDTRGLLCFAFRFVGSLPTADTLIAGLNTNSSPNAELFFRNSDDKLVAAAGGGIASGQAGPVIIADTWYWVEMHSDISANPHVLDWWVDGTAQTQSTVANIASTFFSITLGIDQAVTCRYDDVLVYTDTADITAPVGPHKIPILSVDPAGTVTASDGGTDFRWFSSNGTINAWNATSVRDAVDEIPPTIGATADGAVQITADTVNYMEFPMTSYTLASGETITGARTIVPGWAAAATAATIGLRSYNGSTEATLQAGTVDPNFDNSTTSPAWLCKMLPVSGNGSVIDQTTLDALALRLGFSSDATPDIGAHALYVELAVKESTGITGTVAVTQEDQTSTATGWIEITGTVAVTQEDQTSTASGTVINEVTGTVAVTQDDQTSTATGQLGYSGTLATTQDDQTSTATGQLGYTGTAAVTQDDQISTATGTVAGIGEITGTAAVTQEDQTSAATGQLGYTGMLAVTQEDQISAASGTVVIPITGTVAAIQEDQTSTATGQLGVTGTVAAIQDSQTVVASGWIEITGTVAAIQDDQIGTITGFVGDIPIPAGIPLTVPAGTHAVTSESGHQVEVPAGSHVVEASR